MLFNNNIDVKNLKPRHPSRLQIKHRRREAHEQIQLTTIEVNQLRHRGPVQIQSLGQPQRDRGHERESQKRVSQKPQELRKTSHD